jgi:hypothetical protein
MIETVSIIKEPAEIVIIEEGDSREIVEVYDEITEVAEIAGQGIPGADGHTPTDDELLDLITPLIPLGNDANYIHNQIGASSLWVITHNLGKYPSVTVVDSGGSVVVGDVTYTSLNSLTISFSSPFGGKAFLN